MKIIDTESDFFFMLGDIARAKVLYVDTETTGLDPYTSKFLLLQIHTGAVNYIVDFLALDLELLKLLKFTFEDATVTKVFHNAVFDWKMLKHSGDFEAIGLHCTMVTDQMLNAGLLSGYSLADVALRRLNIDVDKSVREQFINRDITIPFTKEELEYAALDTEILVPIYAQQIKELEEKNLQRVYELECGLIPVTAAMEYRGLLVDRERLELARPMAEAFAVKANVGLQDAFIEMGAASQILFTKEGYVAVKTSSNPQMLQAFHTAGIAVESLKGSELAEWDTFWAAKNQVKIDEIVRQDIDIDDDDVSFFHHPLLKKHDIRKTAAKLKGTFLDGVHKAINPVTHAVHPHFNQCGAAATGRYSSSEINFQNIVKPAKIKAIGLDERCYVRPLFIARPGHMFIIADYSGIELAVLAIMAGDQRLLDQVVRGDVHTYVANNLEGPRIERITGSLITAKNKKDGVWEVARDSFKKVNYSIAYGTSEFGMHKKQYLQLASIGIPITVKDTKRWLDTWKHELFPDVGKFLNANAEFAVTRHYTESVLGRKRFWPDDIRSDKWRAMAAQREGMNQPIQASSADMTKTALYMLSQRLDKRYAHIVATVHDEIIVEVRKDYAEQYKILTADTMREAGYVLFPSAPKGLVEVEAQLSDRYNK